MKVLPMKIETIDFREFMSGTYRKPTRPTHAHAGFFSIITPQKLFPIHDVGFTLLLTGVGTITLAAVAERMLARGGMPGTAQFIADVGRFVFPIVIYGSVLWLFLFGLRGL